MTRLRTFLAFSATLLAPSLGAQNPTQATATTAVPLDSARQDLALIRRADAARTYRAASDSTAAPATLTLHEFVDHACPSCRAFTLSRGDSLRALARSRGVDIVVRVSPIAALLRGGHAAEAAFCAGALGGARTFTTMHHLLFDEQERWRHLGTPLSHFVRMAHVAGVDSVAFRRCVANGTMRPLVIADQQLAGRLAVDGTPTLIITRGDAADRGVRVVGDPSMSRVAAALDDASQRVALDPTAADLVGRWRVDSLELFPWQPMLTDSARSALNTGRTSVARTMQDIRRTGLVIETTFEPSLRYTHQLKRGEGTVYSERGAWAVPGTTGQLYTATERGTPGTNHRARVVGRRGDWLVLENHFTDGASAGLAERVFLRRVPDAR